MSRRFKIRQKAIRDEKRRLRCRRLKPEQFMALRRRWWATEPTGVPLDLFLSRRDAGQ